MGDERQIESGRELVPPLVAHQGGDKATDGCNQAIYDSCSNPSGPQAPNQPSCRLRVRVGRPPKENPTTYSRHRETRGTVGSVTQNMIKTSRKLEGRRACRIALPYLRLFSSVSMKLTAAGCQRPALVLEERNAAPRCLGSPYPAQKRLRKNGLSERRRVPRGDSDGRTAERCFQWATLAGLSSRIQP